MHPRRRPWLAVVLNILASPGLGHLYNGQAMKAVAWLIGLPFAVSLLLWMAATLPVPLLNLALPLTLLIAIYAWAALDAGRTARRLSDAPRPWHSRWYTLVLVWALNAFVVVPVWSQALLTSVMKTAKVPTGGMERTVLVGDYIFVDMTAYGLRVPFTTYTVLVRSPQRGDVIVFLFPEDRRRMFLKRVIGLPGETVEVRDTIVSIDGKTLPEAYAFFEAPHAAGHKGFPPERVPPGHLFVLGDNRDNSRDSRYWGFLPLSDVLGEAKGVYFSHELSRDDRPGKPALEPIRWNRIGSLIR